MRMVEQYPDQEGGRLADLAVRIPAIALRRLQ